MAAQRPVNPPPTISKSAVKLPTTRDESYSGSTSSSSQYEPSQTSARDGKTCGEGMCEKTIAKVQTIG